MNDENILVTRAGDIKLALYERDLNEEKILLQKSRVEIALRNGIENGNFIAYFPGFKKLEFGNFLYRQGIADYILCLDTPSVQNACNYRVVWSERVTCNEGGLLPANSSEMVMNMSFQVLRLYSEMAQIPFSDDAIKKMETHDWKDVPPKEKYFMDPCVASERWFHMENTAASFLAKRCGIPEGVFAEMPADGVWKKTNVDEHELCKRNYRNIVFRNTDGSFCFALVILSESTPENPFDCCFLPVIFYCKNGFEPLLQYGLPCNRLCIYNADKIHSAPGATVHFTDELAIPLLNGSDDPDTIFSSYYGGDEALEHTDFSVLKGHDVKWLLFPRKGERQTDCYARAMKVAAHLYKQGIEMTLVEFEGCEWGAVDSRAIVHGTYSGKKEILFYDFVKKVKKLGYYLPETFSLPRFENITSEELSAEKGKSFLMELFIREDTYTLMYGGTGVAKTWMSFSIALSVASGKPMFENTWAPVNKEGVKVLYVAGEMSVGEFGERMNMLAPDLIFRRKFSLNRVADLKVDTEEGQKELLGMIENAKKYLAPYGDPVKLLVLDNLTTLSDAGENPAKFSKIFLFFEELKRKGISVLLNHHENGDGDFRGSRKILDMADFEIHLYKVHQKCDEKISVIVKTGKKRSLSNSQCKPFRATRDLTRKDNLWQKENLSNEELDAIDANTDSVDVIRKSMEGLLPWAFLSERARVCEILRQRICGKNDNRQIAANLSTSESTVAEFRKNLSIRDEEIAKLVNHAVNLLYKEKHDATADAGAVFEIAARFIGDDGKIAI